MAARGVSIAVNLVAVPLTLRYLGKPEYGLWAAITSLTMWITLFDFGLVNGLVNAVSEAHGRDDRESLARYVSTAFFVLVALSVVLALMLAASFLWVSWSEVFAASGVVTERTARLSVVAAAAPMIVGFPLGIVRQIYTGLQRTYVGNAFSIVASIATLPLLIAVIRADGGLPLLVLVVSGTGVALTILNLAYLIVWEMPDLRPRISLVTRSAARRLMRTSLPLFLYQLGALSVNNTQMLVLAHRANLSVVADFAVITRLYMLFAGFIPITTNSFLPAFREAVERGEREWMIRSFRRMLRLRIGFASISALVMLALGNAILSVWLSEAAPRFSLTTWVAVAVLLVSATWVTAFADLLTIMDRIWPLVASVIVNGAVTIALTWWLVPRWGVTGAMIAAAAMSASVLVWVMPHLARPILGRSGARPAS